MIAVKMIEMDPIESACLRPVTEARYAGSRGFADKRLARELRTIAAMSGLMTSATSALMLFFNSISHS